MGDCFGMDQLVSSSVTLYSFFMDITYLIVSLQVEVSGGRGRPSTIVDKDEGLGKVSSMAVFSLDMLLIFSIICGHAATGVSSGAFAVVV